jgi:sialic acid synthase SpsE
VALLHGLESFPTAVEELRFGDIPLLRERYRVPVGFLDHTDGGSAFALVAPALAAAHGADLVEKRFTLDRREKGLDYASALSPEDFYRMVELLRQAERAMGEGPPAEARERYRRALARSIVASSLIPRGEVLTASMLAFKKADARFAPGLPPKEADRIIGRRAARPIQADEVIREDMLE